LGFCVCVPGIQCLGTGVSNILKCVP